MASTTTPNLNRFYIHGDDIGLITVSVTDTSVSTPYGSSATVKLWGRFEETDITAGDRSVDSSSFSLINDRYHYVVTHAVLSELPIETQNFHEARYREGVRKIKSNQNILHSKRRIRQWDY